MSAVKSPARILVTGDVSYDYNVYLPADADRGGGTGTTRFTVSTGGAGIIGRLLGEDARFAFAEKTVPVVASPMAGLWKLEDAGKVFKPTAVGARPCKVWRLQQSIALGDAQELTSVIQAPPAMRACDATDGRVLVINDDGGKFRMGEGRAEWPAILKSLPDSPPKSLQWIVMKMTRPLFMGDLWWQRTMNPQASDRLVVVVTAGDLRNHAVRISSGVSWERTAADLVRELVQNPLLGGLRKAKHVVVTLQSEGAVILSRESEDAGAKGAWEARLVFDPQRMEGEWPKDVGIEGRAYGYTAAMTAAIAIDRANGGTRETLAKAVIRGLRASRLLRAMGHVAGGSGTSAGLQIPHCWVSEVIRGDAADGKWTIEDHSVKAAALGSWSEIGVPCEVPGTQGGRWRILEHACNSKDRPKDEPLYGAARRLAVFGAGKGLPNVPIAQFGEVVTVDRDEIEALRNIQRLIQQYDGDKSRTKPLSLAVFGPPGAGKSFGVKMIAESILDKKNQGKKNPVCTFNLSQFESPAALVGLFHQVRDHALKGFTPVVFWDEFDSREGFWLQYFLAPMQDGEFQEGQTTHPIGRCIFVFAGATSYSFEHFSREPEDVGWKQRKGPDFVSRLHGYLNVLGPNRRQKWVRDEKAEKRDDGCWVVDKADVCFPVRRAILLRSWLKLVKEKKDVRLQIDHGLLAALLEADRYTHGARSMQRIVESVAAGREPFGRSSLPSDELLGLDTDADDFQRIMARSHGFEISAEELAPQIHEFYRELAAKDGWKPAYDVPYEQLPDPIKGDNIAAARRIPWILGLVGLYLVRGEQDQSELAAVNQIIGSNIELLAEEEHDLWMEFKVQAGWKLGPRDDRMKMHPCLKAYKELDSEGEDKERDRNKDRSAVKHYPDIAKRAGCMVVRQMPRDAALAGE